MKPLCSSRAVRLFAYVISLAAAWYSVPVFDLLMRPVWRGVFAWVVGSLVFLVLLACLYALESIAGEWGNSDNEQ